MNLLHRCSSTGGTVTLTSWGTIMGSSLTGTYSANVSGTREYLDDYGYTTSETLSGTISGVFNVVISEGS